MKVRSDLREGLRYWVQSRISNFNEALDEVRSLLQREARHSDRRGSVARRKNVFEMSGKDRRSCLKRADYCEDRLEEARAEHARSTRVENLGRNGCDDACCSTSVGHEEQLEISRTEFESFVRDGFYFEEDTLEELRLDEVVAGVNRELDLMKSFPVFQAVPRAEVTGKVWSTRWCYKRKGPKQVRARFVVRHFANTLDANFCTV